MAKSKKHFPAKKISHKTEKFGIDIYQILRVVAVIFTIVLLVFLSLILFFSHSESMACTMEAKLCPDGSYVGRTGPNCEFISCPEDRCSHFDADSCPSDCVICPPCEVCSSISCRTEEFCNSMGFNSSWWDSVRPDR